MIYYGELINGLIFVTNFSKDDNYPYSKSYIYYDNKEICYENLNLLSIKDYNEKKQKKIYDTNIETIYKRLRKDTDYIFKSKETKKKLKNMFL